MPTAEIGQRVQVEIAGLQAPGVSVGGGVSASGTIVGIDAGQGLITVQLDVAFSGQDTVVVPAARVTAIE
jgi:hypothetical protein